MFKLLSPLFYLCDFEKAQLKQRKCVSFRGMCGWLTDWESFLLLLNWALASAVLDEDSRKHLAPDTSFIIEEERNVKWQGHLMSREELKRQAQYSSADGVLQIHGPEFSLYAKPYPTLNNQCWVCVKGNDQHVAKTERGFVEWSCIPFSAWKGYLKKYCMLWKESIYSIWANLLIMNLCLSSLETFTGWKCWLVESKATAVSTGNVSQRGKKTSKSIYTVYLQFL